MRDGAAARLALMAAICCAVFLMVFAVGASAELPRAMDVDVDLRPASSASNRAALPRMYHSGRPLRSATMHRKPSAPLASSLCSGLILRGSKSSDPLEAEQDETLQKLPGEEGESREGADDGLCLARATDHGQGLPCGCPSPACLEEELPMPMRGLRGGRGGGGRGRREDHDEDELEYGTCVDGVHICFRESIKTKNGWCLVVCGERLV